MGKQQYIPEMTNPLGRHWIQPNKNEMLIDENIAVMSKAAFDKLEHYECSNPSGVYSGKMWRWKNFLMWYGIEIGNACTIESRKIELLS
jgi:hypothetical protein